MPISRRSMLSGSTVAGAALALPIVSSPAGAAAAGASQPRRSHRRLFPALQSKPGDLLALPHGFRYDLVSVAGHTDMADGLGKSPGRPDGTGCFAVNRRWRLVQNHELGPGDPHPVPAVAGTIYDPGLGAGAGGCTVIETTADGHRRTEWVGLSGTISNCAGGPTPWGSWLTCEETEQQAGTARGAATLERDHGYVFEVFPERDPQQQLPLPILAWGRFSHEGIAVHPNRAEVLLTEDASAPNGLLYRWVAPTGVRLGPGMAGHLGAHDGYLQAMRVVLPDGSALPDLAYVTSAEIGRPFHVQWTEVPDRAARSVSVREQFEPDQVTRSKKLEGAWATRDGVYFAASFAVTLGTDLPADAVQHDGQLWYYDYRAQTLTLQAYFPYVSVQHDGTDLSAIAYPDRLFDGPDNVHVTPYGTVVLAEDGENYQHLISWTPDDGAQAIARNLIGFDGGYAEMTGPTFSPNGSVLFANVQEPGHTFAVRGPWRRYLG